ncbi:MAG: response regulator [Chloroflexi bacterium]|nr:MAG: response regulator [Chloroflexota bacterium]
MFSAQDGPPKVLIIDDNEEFCKLLARYARLLKFHPVTTTSFRQAKILLEEAQRNGEKFVLATIDLRFPLGEGSEKTHVLQGAEILQYIKIEYPEVACLMISGETISPSKLLDLRDYYGLDYYLPKDGIEPLEVAKAISRAFDRVKVVQNESMACTRTTNSISARRLREIIDKCYNEEELRDLCFNIDVEYEMLGGTGISGKSRELISYAKRHGRYYELVNVCHSLRPHAF